MKWICRLVLLWSVALQGVPAFAWQPPPAQGEFVPINQLPPGDQLPAAPLLIAAYAFVWIALVAYLWSIWRRLGRVEHDMHALERRAAPRGDTR